MGLDVYALPAAGKPTASDLNGAEAYFRDTYNSVSLANWLARNVDPKACGSLGLAIFTEPREKLNSAAWRHRLLELALFWFERARKLRGQITYAGYPGDPPEPVAPEETDLFIEECEALLEFALKVDVQCLKVHVWG